MVMASTLLTLRFYGVGSEIVAAGFLVFAVGEGVMLSGVASDLPASVPSFGGGTAMWVLALALISTPRAFPFLVRVLGVGTSVMFAATAGQIFAGVQVLPTSSPTAVLRLSFLCHDVHWVDLDTLEGCEAVRLGEGVKQSLD